MIDNDETVELESVYVPLTIIKEKPRPVDPKDETTYSEIALNSLTHICDGHVT